MKGLLRVICLSLSIVFSAADVGMCSSAPNTVPFSTCARFHWSRNDALRVVNPLLRRNYPYHVLHVLTPKDKLVHSFVAQGLSNSSCVNSNGATIRIASSELLSGIRVLNSDETRQLDNGFHDFEGEFVATVFQKTTIAGIEGYKPLLIDVISRLTLENLSEDEVNDIRTHGIELVYIGTSQSLDNAAEEFLACESLKNVVTLKVLASVGTAKAILALANLYTSGLYGFHRNADTAHSLKAFVQQLAFEPNPN